MKGKCARRSLSNRVVRARVFPLRSRADLPASLPHESVRGWQAPDRVDSGGQAGFAEKEEKEMVRLTVPRPSALNGPAF